MSHAKLSQSHTHTVIVTPIAVARASPIVTATAKVANEVRNEQVNNIEAIRPSTTFSHLPNYCTT